MAKWHKVSFNAQNIEHETANAVLINMRHNSAYDGFQFWNPKMLVRVEGYNLTFSFTDEFEFKLVKHVKGRYNQRDIIDQKTISADEMLEQW